METNYYIECPIPSKQLVEGLAALTIDVVGHGASIGFMNPLSLDRAIGFWEKVMERVAQGNVVLLVAKESGSEKIIGTVQLIVDMPDNQPHRGDVAKMQVHHTARRQGVGEALLKQVEIEATKVGKTLLVLDTVTGSDGYRPVSYTHLTLPTNREV